MLPGAFQRLKKRGGRSRRLKVAANRRRLETRDNNCRQGPTAPSLSCVPPTRHGAVWLCSVKVRMLDGEAPGLEIWADGSCFTKLRAFPELPSEVLAGLPPAALDRELLCGVPEMWSSLGESALAELLWHALVIYGITDDVQRTGPLSDLYTVAIHRLSPEARVGVIQRLAEYSEQSRRDGRYVSGVSFLAAIKMDPDFRVASTAVLNSAVLLGHAEDPMMGRRHAHQLAIETEDPERRAWLLCGLVTLADAQTLALLRGCWRGLTVAGQNRLAETAGRLPFASVAEFLLVWAEDALDRGDEDEMARALGALGRLARESQAPSENPYAGRGICVLERKFPAWAHPADQIVKIASSMPFRQFGRVIEPRLRAIAQRERETSRIGEHALMLWGL
jgi:hypothetical protein